MNPWQNVSIQQYTRNVSFTLVVRSNFLRSQFQPNSLMCFLSIQPHTRIRNHHNPTHVLSDSVVDNKDTHVSAVADQLIDFSLESTTTAANNGSDGLLLPSSAVNFNNNLLGDGSDTLNLVNPSGDSHEHKGSVDWV